MNGEGKGIWARLAQALGKVVDFVVGYDEEAARRASEVEIAEAKEAWELRKINPESYSTKLIDYELGPPPNWFDRMMHARLMRQLEREGLLDFNNPDVDVFEELRKRCESRKRKRR